MIYLVPKSKLIINKEKNSEVHLIFIRINKIKTLITRVLTEKTFSLRENFLWTLKKDKIKNKLK